MSARQARLARRCKALAAMYCYPDGTLPGPRYTLDFGLKLIYASVREALWGIQSPLLANIAPFRESDKGSSFRWGGNGVYWDMTR